VNKLLHYPITCRYKAKSNEDVLLQADVHFHITVQRTVNKWNV